MCSSAWPSGLALLATYMGVSQKLGDQVLGFPRTRTIVIILGFKNMETTIVFRDLDWRPSMYGNYHMRPRFHVHVLASGSGRYIHAVILAGLIRISSAMASLLHVCLMETRDHSQIWIISVAAPISWQTLQCKFSTQVGCAATQACPDWLYSPWRFGVGLLEKLVVSW